MKFKKIITLTSLVSVICAVVMTVSAAAAAPAWLGGDLKKPLSETRLGFTVLYPVSTANQA